MAIQAPKGLDEEAIAAQFAAAEAANLSFKSTAALRGGSKPSSDPDQQRREQDRQRRLEFFERKPRPEQNADQQSSPSPPSRKFFFDLRLLIGVLLTSCQQAARLFLKA